MHLSPPALLRRALSGVGATGSPPGVHSGAKLVQNAAPGVPWPQPRVSRRAGEPLTLSGWAAAGRHHCPRPPGPPGDRQRGCNPASPVHHVQRGKGRQRAAQPSRLAHSDAPVRGMHDEHPTADGADRQAGGLVMQATGLSPLAPLRSSTREARYGGQTCALAQE